MDFTTIGTITSYLKQKNMRYAANYKMKTGQNVTDANGNLNFAKTEKPAQTVQTSKKSEKEIAEARLASIKQKLANGRKLSNEELTYLQSREPKTYKRAKHADEAREELKGELRKAKTKQEARQAVTQAMIRASTQASADIADYKSNSSASDSKSTAETNFSSVNGLSNALHKTFAENWGYTEETNYHPPDLENSESENLDEEENPFANYDFSLGAAYYRSQTPKSTKTQNADKQDSPQEIMESFIMTIRALEAEWAQFTKSKEYEELPENRREEEFLKSIGEEKHKEYYKELDRPRAKNLNAAAAYRTSMMFTTSQFVVSPLPKFEAS